MVEKIKEIAGDNAVVFMTGDLNTTSEDKALKPLATYLKESGKTVKRRTKPLLSMISAETEPDFK